MFIKVRDKVTIGVQMYQLVWHDGRLIFPEQGLSVLANTGPYGNGPLPAGIYRVSVPVQIEAGGGNEPYTDKEGFAWWCGLEPTFETDRDGLGIHPDGNVPGTEGCIGIVEENTRPIFDALSELVGQKNANVFLVVMG